jgi:catechol 2,3-dioxygenase-like lactoylglutathione lyase family enzyme
MAEFQGLSTIGQIALRVHDVEAAAEYYRDRLGMRLLFMSPAPNRMAFFDCGGIRLLLGLPEGDEHDHPGSILYFEVEGIEAVHAELADRGVEFIEAPRKVADLEDRELWLGFFHDPWQNVLALMEERPAG